MVDRIERSLPGVLRACSARSSTFPPSTAAGWWRKWRSSISATCSARSVTPGTRNRRAGPASTSGSRRRGPACWPTPPCSRRSCKTWSPRTRSSMRRAARSWSAAAGAAAARRSRCTIAAAASPPGTCRTSSTSSTRGARAGCRDHRARGCAPADAATAPVAARRRATPLDGLRILLIEDDREVRDATTALLGSGELGLRSPRPKRRSVAAPAICSSPISTSATTSARPRGDRGGGRGQRRRTPAITRSAATPRAARPQRLDADTPVLAKPVRPAALRAAIAAQWLARPADPPPPRPAHARPAAQTTATRIRSFRSTWRFLDALCIPGVVHAARARHRACQVRRPASAASAAAPARELTPSACNGAETWMLTVKGGI